jgi:predicted ATP-grasp superfamily ATP-dependent carboligase
VVRTLGRQGVSVYVITDDEASLSAQSRYCRGAYFRTKGHTRETADDLATLRDLASQLGNKPVVFPTADPDLLLLSRLRDQVSPVARLFLAQPEIVDALSDKRRFIDFAERYKLPVPKTWAPQNQADAVAASREARYPVVLKPSTLGVDRGAHSSIHRPPESAGDPECQRIDAGLGRDCAAQCRHADAGIYCGPR